MAVEAPTRPPGTHQARALLPYEPRSASNARHLVRDALREWGLEELADAAELVVSELVGNAAKTGCHLKMAVTIERTAAASVRISVRDGSRSLPCLIDAGPDSESGRGMLLVHHLTAGRWGARIEGASKAVWAIIGHTDRPEPGSTEPGTAADADSAWPAPDADRKPTGERSPEAWLAAAAGPRSAQARQRWRQDGGLARLPIGTRWDVVRMPARIGHPLLDELRTDSSQRRLGPVLLDRHLRTLLWLVTPGHSDHWPPDVDLIRTGVLLCPRPGPAPAGDAVRVWAHWPAGEALGTLTSPPWLAAALTDQARTRPSAMVS